MRLLFILFLLFFSCTDAKQTGNKADNQPAKEKSGQKAANVIISNSFKLDAGDYNIEVVKKLNHDSMAYTQGLLYYDGYLYESTGNYGKSSIRKVEINTGNVLNRRNLPDYYFGEGLALHEGILYQLTWRNKVCFAYDINSFDNIATYAYEGEGWGITCDGQSLIMSDGSNTLKFINPKSFDVIRKINVFDKSIPLDNLNELEYINGEIWANVYLDSKIIRIDPSSGQKIGVIELKELYTYLPPGSSAEVLNGIAFDAINNRFYLTGKNWPFLFEVKFVKSE